MRRLTLILSDLYLPGEITRGDIPRIHELPAFEQLLRFADRRPVPDWRQWLAGELGVPEFSRLLAHVCARAAGREIAGAWMATPVRLEPRLDHVRMTQRGLIRLTNEQAHELSREFAATFAPLELVACGERALLLTGGPRGDLPTVDPARLLDADIKPALPAGPAAKELRRLIAEIEMWLPGTRANAARERAGMPKITALWLWGGGLPVPQESDSLAVDKQFALYGGDPLLTSLADLQSFPPVHPAPASLAGLSSHARAYVELAPMSGPASEALPALDANWLAPALDALRQGSLEQLMLVANDRVFDVKPHASWKFWRRRRHWLDLLKA
jgi:hypothetical protein